MSNARLIGLFGGTFDPVHRGHLHVAELARKALALDEVRFLPCQISPHKAAAGPAAPGAVRLEMLRLATDALPWAVVDDTEIRRAGPSYSYQTAEAIAERFPTDRLFWIMGGDQWDALPRWRHPERLAARCEFIVLARDQSSPAPREGYRLHAVAGGHLASATAIREFLARGGTTHPWLEPEVVRYLAQHAIYRPS